MTSREYIERKQKGEKIVILTAYDYPTARFVSEAGVDLILVGDSLGMVILGLPDTTGVTMADMEGHIRAVRRGAPQSLVIGDLPYATYTCASEGVANSRRLVDAGADAVKLEGGASQKDTIKAITNAGIPCMGHIGMLPQRIREEGRYRRKGVTPDEAARLLDDALAVEAAGAFAVVLELIGHATARTISRTLKIPTIGIGSGPHCDGQVLVLHDVAGCSPWFRPKFAPAYADAAGEFLKAAKRFVIEVRAGQFPG
jgi:3-methyl-2-oxobutanoate hydroxymethyltransferase